MAERGYNMIKREHCERDIFILDVIKIRCPFPTTYYNVQQRATTCKNVQERATTCNNVQQRATTWTLRGNNVETTWLQRSTNVRERERNDSRRLLGSVAFLHTLWHFPRATLCHAVPSYNTLYHVMLRCTTLCHVSGT